MYATNYFETGILNTMRGVALTAPSSLYLGLYITDPGEAGQGTELSYEGYRRQLVAFSAPAPESGGVGIQNEAQITFPTASGDAGTVTHIGLLDSAVGGNMLAYGQLIDPLGVMASTAPVFLAGEVKYYLTGDLSTAYKTKFLNVLRGQSVSGFEPYLALFGGNPDDGGAELSGSNYARVALPLTAPSESESGQMRCENPSEISFPRPTSAWGSWDFTAVYDAPSGGQPVWRQPKTPPWELKKGRMPIMDAGALRLAVN